MITKSTESIGGIIALISNSKNLKGWALILCNGTMTLCRPKSCVCLVQCRLTLNYDVIVALYYRASIMVGTLHSPYSRKLHTLSVSSALEKSYGEP